MLRGAPASLDHDLRQGIQGHELLDPFLFIVNDAGRVEKFLEPARDVGKFMVKHGGFLLVFSRLRDYLARFIQPPRSVDSVSDPFEIHVCLFLIVR